MPDQINVRQGFTLIELSLSIAFIAVLSIAVLLVISNSVSSYHRGITLNQINTVGMDLVDDMRTVVQSSPGHAFDNECPEGSERNEVGCQVLVSGKKQAEEVKIGGKTISEVPVYGVFCTGEYSYIWNSGYVFNSAVSINGETEQARKPHAAFKNGEKDSEKIVRLMKVSDELRAVCRGFDGGQKEGETNFVWNVENGGGMAISQDLLEADNLALYDLSVPLPAKSGEADNMFYSASFILGTIQGGINVKASGNFCTPPNDKEWAEMENFDYCAINKFNFAAQATGGVGQ